MPTTPASPSSTHPHFPQRPPSSSSKAASPYLRLTSPGASTILDPIHYFALIPESTLTPMERQQLHQELDEIHEATTEARQAYTAVHEAIQKYQQLVLSTHAQVAAAKHALVQARANTNNSSNNMSNGGTRGAANNGRKRDRRKLSRKGREKPRESGGKQDEKEVNGGLQQQQKQQQIQQHQQQQQYQGQSVEVLLPAPIHACATTVDAANGKRSATMLLSRLQDRRGGRGGDQISIESAEESDSTTSTTTTATTATTNSTTTTAITTTTTAIYSSSDTDTFSSVEDEDNEEEEEEEEEEDLETRLDKLSHQHQVLGGRLSQLLRDKAAAEQAKKQLNDGLLRAKARIRAIEHKLGE
ncbi:hypothetical protein FBU30_005467 [Linnemannia zychae]|nr:hypothetical protein FBU30_005467 [Linnemannia zychae]